MQRLFTRRPLLWFRINKNREYLRLKISIRSIRIAKLQAKGWYKMDPDKSLTSKKVTGLVVKTIFSWYHRMMNSNFLLLSIAIRQYPGHSKRLPSLPRSYNWGETTIYLLDKILRLDYQASWQAIYRLTHWIVHRWFNGFWLLKSRMLNSTQSLIRA